MRHFARLILLIALLCLLPACGGDGGAAASNNDITPPADMGTVVVPPTDAPVELPVNADNVKLVARVNGQEITLPQFEQAYNRRQQEMIGTDPSALAAVVMDTLIEQVLIDQAAVELGLAMSDTDLDMEVQSFIDEAGGTEIWQQWLDSNAYTQEEFRETLRTMTVTTRVRDSVAQPVSGLVKHVHARHILVKTEDEAAAVLTRLSNGEDFAAVAAEVSQDVTSAQQGGDLGWFTEGELLEPSLAQVAFSLLPGQIAGPVPTRLGYHIIQTLEFEERPVDPDKQISLAQIQFENWLQTQREKATIERYM